MLDPGLVRCRFSEYEHTYYHGTAEESCYYAAYICRYFKPPHQVEDVKVHDKKRDFDKQHCWRLYDRREVERLNVITCISHDFELQRSGYLNVRRVCLG